MGNSLLTRSLAAMAIIFSLGGASAAPAAEPILMGAPLTLSPPGPVVWGEQVREGVEVIRQIVNEDGGVNGSTIEVLYEDTQGNPERGRSATEKLITRDKVVAIIGADVTPVTLAAIEIAHQYNTPYFNTNGWSDTIRSKGYPQVFNPNAFISLTVNASVKFLTELGKKRVVGIINNDEAGIQHGKGIMEGLKAANADIEFEPLYIDRNNKDFLPIILPMKASPPDVILVSAQQPAVYIVLRQLFEQGVAPSARTMLFDEGAISDSPDFWTTVGEGGKYMMSLGMYHPNLALTPLGEKFRDRYNEAYGRLPGRLAFQAADSFLTAVEGIRLAGSTDSDAIQAALRTAEITGTRGVMKFSQEPGVTFQQWVDTPYAIYQLTEVNQPIEDSIVLTAPGMPLDPGKIQTP